MFTQGASWQFRDYSCITWVVLGSGRVGVGGNGFARRFFKEFWALVLEGPGMFQTHVRTSTATRVLGKWSWIRAGASCVPLHGRSTLRRGGKTRGNFIENQFACPASVVTEFHIMRWFEVICFTQLSSLWEKLSPSRIVHSPEALETIYINISQQVFELRRSY